MAFEPLVVTVDGKSMRLFHGATVRHALYNTAADLVRRVEHGEAVVWDEQFDAQTDLGGALYNGQRLSVRTP
ncbi:MAG: hypothetical protein ACYC5Y_14945 [Symbiobacteriia bacterium]